MPVNHQDRARRSQLVWLLLVVVVSPVQAALAQGTDVAGLGAPGEGGLVDRVVAIVGDSAIFYSEVSEQVVRLRAAGMELPTDAAELGNLERGVLDEIVNQTLLLNAAAQDTLLSVPEARLDQEVDNAWQEVINRFGSEAAATRAVEAEGLTMAQYRATQQDEIRRSILVESYVQARRSETRILPVEEVAMREFFDEERESLGNRPATMTFEQVVISPHPSDSVRAEARSEALDVRALIDGGDDFAELAGRFSEDPGSAQRGGDLGWVRRGVMVEEFEDAAFQMARGAVSDIVETQFGAHILQVQRIRGAERLVRHILIAVEPTAEDVVAARERAMEIRELVTAGTPLESFLDEGDETGLPHPMTLTIDRLGQLPSGLASALGTAEVGAVLGPIQIEIQPGLSSYSVLEVHEIREAGELTYEDVRDQIRAALQDQRFQDQLYDQLRSESYIEIRW